MLQDEFFMMFFSIHTVRDLDDVHWYKLTTFIKTTITIKLVGAAFLLFQPPLSRNPGYAPGYPKSFPSK